MSTDLTALLVRATLDAVTGQVRYPDGMRICYHARQTSAARDFHPGWYRRRDGHRWVLRHRARLSRVVTTSCPDCPARSQNLVEPQSGMWFATRLAPFAFVPEGAATC